MFLQPKRSKYKKSQKGKLPKIEYRSNKLNFGFIGLKASESGLISSRQIEAARQAINRRIKRKGKIWIRIFPDSPVTSKPIEVRMGKGKGPVDHWSVKVGAGAILFEIEGVSLNVAKIAFVTGGAKLPISTQISYR
jgi:large subunit ribosomal protein L16